MSPREFNAFIAGLSLEGIRVARLAVDAPHAHTAGRQLIPVVDAEQVEYVGTEAGFVIAHDLRFEGRYEGDAEPVITMEVRLEAGYSTDVPITPEIFEVFRRTSLPLNTWPYFREIVHNSLARTGWPVLVLPAYKDLVRPPR